MASLIAQLTGLPLTAVNSVIATTGFGASQILYVNRHLIKLQTYLILLKDIHSSSKFGEKPTAICLIQQLLKEYKKIIMYDEYCHVRVGKDEWEIQRYEDVKDFIDNEDEVYHGIFKPLDESLVHCRTFPKFESMNERLQMTLIHQILASVNSWFKLEYLVLSMDAALESLDALNSALHLEPE
jgi:hypothetical protein